MWTSSLSLKAGSVPENGWFDCDFRKTIGIVRNLMQRTRECLNRPSLGFGSRHVAIKLIKPGMDSRQVLSREL
jgi:hypothetical protein